MNSPAIWILTPALIGGILLFLRRWHRITVFLGTGTALILAGLAFYLPIEEQIRLGPLVFRIQANLDILGRQFILDNQDRFLVLMSYILVAFWFAGSYVGKAGRVMVPLGMVFVSLLVGAFAVEPFLYGALLFEVAVIVGIPIIVESSILTIGASQVDNAIDRRIDPNIVRGSLRFLILETMGIPFLLITGWVLSGVETTPGDETIILSASLIGFGFMLLFAIFPFHTWILMIIEKAQPYTATFIFVVFFWFLTMFGLRFFDQYVWLRQPGIMFYLQLSGVFIILAASGSVLFEQNLGRMLGYAILIESGYIFLAGSLESDLSIIFQMLVPRTLSFGVWALALVLIKEKTNTLNLSSVHGFFYEKPLTGIALVLAQMSIAGLPLLASFPIRFTLWQLLSKQSVWASWLSIAGFVGLFFASIRTIMVFIDREPEERPIGRESWQIYLLLTTAILVMIIMGLFPQLFLPVFSLGLQAFQNLTP